MAAPTYRMRTGTVHGVRHEKLGINNQDAVLVQEFRIPKWQRSFRVGLVSDGCSGIPAFTHSEVGANLLVVYCLGRIQELIISGAKMAEIPLPLYHSVTNFLRDLANTVMPATIYWPYPVQFKRSHEFRNTQKATQRFMVDYLAATILGFVDDGTTLVTFRAGDGVIVVNDKIEIVDQNDIPDYPVGSINSPGSGFQVEVYDSAAVRKLALATDGIEELLKVTELRLADTIFTDASDNPMGLQYLLNRLRKQHGEKMGDDCTVATLERIEGGVS